MIKKKYCPDTGQITLIMYTEKDSFIYFIRLYQEAKTDFPDEAIMCKTLVVNHGKKGFKLAIIFTMQVTSHDVPDAYQRVKRIREGSNGR